MKHRTYNVHINIYSTQTVLRSYATAGVQAAAP